MIDSIIGCERASGNILSHDYKYEFIYCGDQTFDCENGFVFTRRLYYEKSD